MEYRIDLFSFFILLGVVQAVFLSFFFLNKKARKLPINRLQGWFLIVSALGILEIFLKYTGYIRQVLHLVNFSEPIVFLFGPLIFLIVRRAIGSDRHRLDWVHWILPIGYFVYSIFLILQPADVKYNHYIYSYHPEEAYLPVEMAFSDDPLGLRPYHTEILMVSILIYIILSLRLVIQFCRDNEQHFFRLKSDLVRRGRNYALLASLILLSIFISESSFPRSFGHHYVASVVTLFIYITSFDVIRFSSAFKNVRADKYSRSALTKERKLQTLGKVKALLEEREPYLEIGFGLGDLAQMVGVSTHHLSEVINDGFGKSFFDLIAEYRVNAACQLLSSPNGANLKIEEIAERVGYSSKSSFNTQFKKVKGETPAAFRNRHI